MGLITARIIRTLANPAKWLGNFIGATWPTLAFVLYLTLTDSSGSPPPSLPSNPKVANINAIPNDLVVVAPPRFVEVAGIADLRAWSDGTTIIYVRDGKIVAAVKRGTANTPAIIPAEGTPLYCSNGRYSGWIVPDVAKTSELQRAVIFDQLSASQQSGPFADLPQESPSGKPDYTAPGVAENGSYYGEISSANGLPRTHMVNGYYRNDGTYVRGYYRSR